MSASLKPVPGRQLRGMRQLESKISDLQSQYQSLLKERQQDITAIIATLDLTSLEDQLIIGGLLFLKEKVTSQNPMVEAWRDAGKKFLHRKKPKKRPGKGEEQAETYLQPRDPQQPRAYQITEKKDICPKQAASLKTTPQSPQKQSQSGEK